MREIYKSLTINDALEILSISRPTIYQLIRSGKLKTYKVGARRFTTHECIEECRQDLLSQTDKYRKSSGGVA